MPINDMLGVSFMPGAEGGMQQDLEPLQEAVKLLNLRLPSVFGAHSPVSPQLLGASGLSGDTDAAFLRRLLGLEMPPPSRPDRPAPPSGGPKQGSPSGTPPPPHIIVGDPDNSAPAPPQPPPAPRPQQPYTNTRTGGGRY